MAINSITNSVAAQQASTYTAAKTDHTEKKSESSTKTDTGVVYEKSSGQTSGTVTKKTDYALVNKLKADAEQRTSQLRSLVEKMIFFLTLSRRASRKQPSPGDRIFRTSHSAPMMPLWRSSTSGRTEPRRRRLPRHRHNPNL